MISSLQAHAGVVCALTAPMCWAVAVILFRRSDLPPAGMNLFKNTVALLLLSATLLALGIGPAPDRSAGDWLRLLISGTLGLAVGDLLLFEGLRRIGAARLALVDTTYAPMMVAMSWGLLGERPSAGFAVGAAAVVGGVALATVDLRRAVAAGDRALGLGVLLAFGAIFSTATSVILAKPILEGANLFEITWVRMLAGLSGQAAWMVARGSAGEIVAAFRPSAAWRTLVPAAVIGTYLSLVLWLGGFKWTDASVAAVLNQLATVYILVLARVVLHEPLGLRQVAGGALAVAGALVVISV